MGLFEGVQGILEAPNSQVPLTQYGSSGECSDWRIPDGSWIKRIELSYNNYDGITHVKFATEKGVNFERG
jgi:hypothetical protein